MPRIASFTPVVLALLLAGCGGESSRSPTRVAATEGSNGNSRRSVMIAPIEPARAIATRKGTIDDSPVTIELTQVRRRGKTVSLELRLSTEEKRGVDLGGSLDDGVSAKLSDPDSPFEYEGYDSMDGVALVDGVTGVRYGPARDEFNNCVCDNLEDRGVNETLTPTASLTLSATYGSPPSGVSSVDVVIPRFGTIPDVPLG